MHYISRLKEYITLYQRDKKQFWYRLWMVVNRYKINAARFFFKTVTRTGTLVTIHTHPLSTRGVKTTSHDIEGIPRTAIVIQGPLLIEHNFTFETVLLYKKHFPETPIIVSVWDTEDKENLHSLEKIGAYIVTSQKPKLPGIGNINLQIACTFAGLTKAKELGAQYVYKTRSDQRMYAPNLNTYLYGLLTLIPMNTGNGRIIASSLATLKYTPFLLTDMWQYGHIDDLLLLWSCPYDERSTLPHPIRTTHDLIKANICEARLCTTFLRARGESIEPTVDSWWHALAKHFIIVDQSSIDLVWYKYDFYKEHRLRFYDRVCNTTPVTFSDWVVLYSSKGNIPLPDPTLLSHEPYQPH